MHDVRSGGAGGFLQLNLLVSLCKREAAAQRRADTMRLVMESAPMYAEPEDTPAEPETGRLDRARKTLDRSKSRKGRGQKASRKSTPQDVESEHLEAEDLDVENELI